MIVDYLPLMYQATLMTLGLAICALFLGFLFAIIGVVLETSKKAYICKPATMVLALLRGLPEILVVFLIYFGSTQFVVLLTGEYVDFNAFSCGVFALALIYAAYASQSLRGAIQAIPVGQWESSTALGLSKFTIFIRIILPQVWRHALPGLTNQWLVLLKDTTLVSLIGVDDLIRRADLINSNVHEPFTWYGIAALIYLVITLISQVGIRYLERRVTRFERGTA